MHQSLSPQSADRQPENGLLALQVFGRNRSQGSRRNTQRLQSRTLSGRNVEQPMLNSAHNRRANPKPKRP